MDFDFDAAREEDFALIMWITDETHAVFVEDYSKPGNKRRLALPAARKRGCRTVREVINGRIREETGIDFASVALEYITSDPRTVRSRTHIRYFIRAVVPDLEARVRAFAYDGAGSNPDIVIPLLVELAHIKEEDVLETHRHLVRYALQCA